MAKLIGSKYCKQGSWWITFPLPPSQVWNDPSAPEKCYSIITTSVSSWYKGLEIDGKGKAGKQWAKRLLEELNNKYYKAGETNPIEHRTTQTQQLAGPNGEVIESIVNEVMKRLRFHENALAPRQVEPPPHLLTYRQAGEMIGGKSAVAVKKMVSRKQLKAVHPNGGRSAFIDSRDLKAYIDSARDQRD